MKEISDGKYRRIRIYSFNDWNNCISESGETYENTKGKRNPRSESQGRVNRPSDSILSRTRPKKRNWPMNSSWSRQNMSVPHS